MDDNLRGILEAEYYALPKKSEIYVKSFDFIENVKLNKKYNSACNNLARRKADKFDLKDEMLCEVLDRMEAESDEFLDFQEILEYFTRRGRPKFRENKEEEKEFKEKYVLLFSDYFV